LRILEGGLPITRERRAVVDARARFRRVLILGSLPGEASLAVQAVLRQSEATPSGG
jgi:hypothetical protein